MIVYLSVSGKSSALSYPNNASNSLFWILSNASDPLSWIFNSSMINIEEPNQKTTQWASKKEEGEKEEDDLDSRIQEGSEFKITHYHITLTNIKMYPIGKKGDKRSKKVNLCSYYRITELYIILRKMA